MHTKNKIGWSRELWHYWGYVVGLFFMESLYEWCSYIRQPFSFLLPEIWVNQDMVSTRDFQGVKYTQCKLTLKEPSMASPIVGFQGGLVIKKKNLPTNAGDMGSIPGSGRSPGGGNGNSLQYSCLESPMNRRAWRAIVHRVSKSWTQLSIYTTQHNAWFLPQLSTNVTRLNILQYNHCHYQYFYYTLHFTKYTHIHRGWFVVKLVKHKIMAPSKPLRISLAMLLSDHMFLWNL